MHPPRRRGRSTATPCVHCRPCPTGRRNAKPGRAQSPTRKHRTTFSTQQRHLHVSSRNRRTGAADAEALMGTEFAVVAHAFRDAVPALTNPSDATSTYHSVPGARAGAENAAQGHTVQITGNVTVIVAQPGAPLTYNTLTTAQQKNPHPQRTRNCTRHRRNRRLQRANRAHHSTSSTRTAHSTTYTRPSQRGVELQADLMVCKPLDALTSKNAGKLIDMMTPYYSTESSSRSPQRTRLLHLQETTVGEGRATGIRDMKQWRKRAAANR